jgi:hypothetical protein
VNVNGLAALAGAVVVAAAARGIGRGIPGLRAAVAVAAAAGAASRCTI